VIRSCCGSARRFTTLSEHSEPGGSGLASRPPPNTTSDLDGMMDQWQAQPSIRDSRRCDHNPLALPMHKPRGRVKHGRSRSLMWSVARGGAQKLSWSDQSVGEPMNHRSEDGHDEADQRRSAALIGLIIILALAIAGVVLVRELRERSRLEDCLMSGRTNCAPIEVPLRR